MKAMDDVMGSAIPIACKLTDDAREERGAALEDDLFSACRGVQELADGYAFRFPGNAPWPARVCQFVIEERDCCPFFRFQIIFEPGSEHVMLLLTGAEGVKEFISQNFPVSASSNTSPELPN